jgi:hypothetical protein
MKVQKTGEPGISVSSAEEEGHHQEVTTVKPIGAVK